VYAWLDLQETSYGFGYGSLRSLAGLVLRPAESSPFASSSPVGTSASDVALVISILNIRRILLGCAWVWGGPSAMLHFPPNYSFFPEAAMPVMVYWQGGDSGEANCRNFRRRRSSLPSVLSFTAMAFPCSYITQTVHFNQYTFMLSLEVMSPGGSLSTVLIATPYWRDAS
jgi:hypothetical protein